MEAAHERDRKFPNWSDWDQPELEGLRLQGVDLRNIDLSDLPLARCELSYARLEGAKFIGTHLERSRLFRAHLEKARLIAAHLEGALLVEARLAGASLGGAHLEGARLNQAHLEGADLFNTFFDAETALPKISLSNKEFGDISIVDVHWNDANVAVVDWSTLSALGLESSARRRKNYSRGSKGQAIRLEKYLSAVRAYLQLSVVLRNQGLSEDAARFAYRAQLMQREVFRLQRKTWRYFGSLFLDVLTGYGFRVWRSFLAYLIVITAFALAYFIVGQKVGPALSPLGAWVFSMTSFHGRGFFSGASS